MTTLISRYKPQKNTREFPYIVYAHLTPPSPKLPVSHKFKPACVACFVLEL